MKSYRSRSGKPHGVTAYEAGDDYIIIRYRGKEIYKYTYESCGKEAVEEMKKLAAQQSGLSTYIVRHAPGYEWKR